MLRSHRVWRTWLTAAEDLLNSTSRNQYGPFTCRNMSVQENQAQQNNNEKPSRFREVPPLEKRDFLPSSQRTGVIAIKAGMTQDWDQYGALLPLTVLWIDDCQVVQVKHAFPDGVTSLQVGCGYGKPKNTHKLLIRHFEAANVPIKRKLHEFRVTPDALLPVGTPLTAAHFMAGQFVDVTGTTIGKGFQGVMKRWGFKGLPASHGVSKAHRSAGATGACQDPGRIWKGKKMAGHMGVKRRTVNNVWVHKVDPVRNLLFVKGQVPGHAGNFVYVRDAAFKKQVDLPFPTYIGDDATEVSVAQPKMDPYHIFNVQS